MPNRLHRRGRHDVSVRSDPPARRRQPGTAPRPGRSSLGRRTSVDVGHVAARRAFAVLQRLLPVHARKHPGADQGALHGARADLPRSGHRLRGRPGRCRRFYALGYFARISRSRATNRSDSSWSRCQTLRPKIRPVTPASIASRALPSIASSPAFSPPDTSSNVRFAERTTASCRRLPLQRRRLAAASRRARRRLRSARRVQRLGCRLGPCPSSSYHWRRRSRGIVWRQLAPLELAVAHDSGARQRSRQAAKPPPSVGCGDRAGRAARADRAARCRGRADQGAGNAGSPAARCWSGWPRRSCAGRTFRSGWTGTALTPPIRR